MSCIGLRGGSTRKKRCPTTAASSSSSAPRAAITLRYRGGVTALQDLTLAVGPGVLGLLGPNGAGKTTLMRMVATLSVPTTGRLLALGIDVAREPDAVRRRLGYLPQDFGLPGELTARESVDYIARLKGVRGGARVDEVLEKVGLSGAAGRPVGGFSGGMRQRVGIAQALVGDPDLLVVDEPTAGLDPEERVRFRNILSDVAGKGLVILSTHVVSDIESVAGTIAVLRSGRLVFLGTPEEMLRAASGHVWEAVLSSAEYERLRGSLVVSSAVRRQDGVHLRLVARPGIVPVASGSPVEPTLEDAYLDLMGKSAGETS